MTKTVDYGVVAEKIGRGLEDDRVARVEKQREYSALALAAESGDEAAGHAAAEAKRVIDRLSQDISRKEAALQAATEAREKREQQQLDSRRSADLGRSRALLKDRISQARELDRGIAHVAELARGLMAAGDQAHAAAAVHLGLDAAHLAAPHRSRSTWCGSSLLPRNSSRARMRTASPSP